METINIQLEFPDSIHISVKIPERCMHCFSIMQKPYLQSKGLSGDHSRGYWKNCYSYIVVLCPQCNKFNFFQFRDSNLNKRQITFNSIIEGAGAILPISAKNKIATSVPHDIVKISPLFEDIYNESHIAESFGLLHIAGMGYRKSLEFLIKDYLILVTPYKKEKYQSMPLNQVIDHLDDKDLITLSRAGAWLGNDESHFIRVYEDKGIKELKDFISETIAIIYKKYTLFTAQSILDSRPPRK